MSENDSPKPNSKFAWSHLARQAPPKRSTPERVGDFLEIYGLYDEATARQQASRCIQCPNPSCVRGCPLCNPIPQWMQLTAEGRFLEAATLLGSATNLSEVCARLCPSERLCEGQCLLDSVAEPVPIQALEQFLVEYGFEHGQPGAVTAPPNGLKVAVVGSGPGGLACAEQLARQGFGVSVLDSALVPGGLLVNGLPAFKLNESILPRRLELLKQCGVRFELGVKLWQELSLEQLRQQYDAVFLVWDSRKARPLMVPGAQLPGVVQALPFLLQKTTSLALDLPRLEVSGQRVVVLGGGDTALDCLRAALRYGAREAIGVYRRAERDMPCVRREFLNALEEGVQFVFCATPAELLASQSGRVRALRLVRTELGPADSEGPRPFLLQAGSDFELQADWVIAALGFEPLGCPSGPDFSSLQLNSWGGLQVDANQMTCLAGVFAGGDLVLGPTPVLQTVRDGRQAAAHIQAYLRGRPPRA